MNADNCWVAEYIKRSKKLLDNDELSNIINYLAAYPKAGNLIQGTGGIRKLRWSKGTSGKSGGVRIIYYVCNEKTPLFLLTVFGKNEKANLTKSERNQLQGLVRLLIKSYGV